MSMEWVVIQQYKKKLQTGDAIANIWTVSDVMALDNTLSQKDAQVILQSAQENFDAEVGINWSVLQTTIRRYLENKGENKMDITSQEKQIIMNMLNTTIEDMTYDLRKNVFDEDIEDIMNEDLDKLEELYNKFNK